MIHETLSYTVPTSSVPACRQAIRELVEHVRKEQSGTILYTVLEDAEDEETTFLHLAGHESPDARQEHHESEALRLFIDLVYPATKNGIHLSEHKVVDRLPDPTERRVRIHH